MGDRVGNAIELFEVIAVEHVAGAAKGGKTGDVVLGDLGDPEVAAAARPHDFRDVQVDGDGTAARCRGGLVRCATIRAERELPSIGRLAAGRPTDDVQARRAKTATMAARLVVGGRLVVAGDVAVARAELFVDRHRKWDDDIQGAIDIAQASV